MKLYRLDQKVYSDFTEVIMESYDIKLIQNGFVFCRGYCEGSSACQALENGFKTGLLFMPSGNDVFEAYALNQQGLVFKFELGNTQYI